MFLINKIVSVAWQLSRIAKILTIIAFYDKYMQIYSCNIKENYLGNKYLGGFIMQRNNTTLTLFLSILIIDMIACALIAALKRVNICLFNKE